MAYGNEVIIPAYSMFHGSGGEGISGNALPASSQTWNNISSASNAAVFVPLYIERPGIITKLWTQNGGTAAGNIDIGLYSCVDGLPATRLVSSGSTAQAGTNVLQEFNITDYPVSGSTVLFLGMASDSSSTTIVSGSLGAAFVRAIGLARQASAFPLPATATPTVVLAGQMLVGCGVAFRALVA